MDRTHVYSKNTSFGLIIQIGPKGLEFARYSLDYHTIRNYLHVNRAWGKQRYIYILDFVGLILM